MCLLVLMCITCYYISYLGKNEERSRVFFSILRPTTRPYHHIYAPASIHHQSPLHYFVEYSFSVHDASPPLAPLQSTNPRHPHNPSSPTPYPGPRPVSQRATYLFIGPPTKDVRQQTVDPTQTYRHRNWHGQIRPFVFRICGVGPLLRFRPVGVWSCTGDSKRVAVGDTAWTRAVDEGVGESGERGHSITLVITITITFTVITICLTLTPPSTAPHHPLSPSPPPPHHPPLQNPRRMGCRSDVPVDVS